MTQYRIDSNIFWGANKTIYEVIFLANGPSGNLVSTGNPLPVTVTQPSNSSIAANPSGMAVDAFGRSRVSTPLTLFDSSHRYNDNGLWVTSNSSGTTITFDGNAGLINLALPTTANAEIIRETTKAFSYQPGKSLQILNTFVFNPEQTNLRQRAGYFGANNGIYLELDGSNLYFVERNYVSGTLGETRVAQADWNIDTLLGNVASSQSKITLDITKAQIMFIDVEWLGLGTIRCGFVIDGRFIHCHSFHHANRISSTYMTTASLPLRLEVKNNNGATGNASVMKQVCSSVISEGGYELRGAQQAVSIPITAPIDLTTAGTYYPIVSIRLKSSPNRLDAIVILTALSILGLTNNCNYNWQVVSNGTTTGGTWVSAGASSAVEYNITGTSFSGGRILASGYTAASAQATIATDILKEALFKFQLERNALTSTPYELTLIAAASTNGGDILASMDWEEVSR
jgi:hypothetical protein